MSKITDPKIEHIAVKDSVILTIVEDQDIGLNADGSWAEDASTKIKDVLTAGTGVTRIPFIYEFKMPKQTTNEENIEFIDTKQKISIITQELTMDEMPILYTPTDNNAYDYCLKLAKEKKSVAVLLIFKTSSVGAWAYIAMNATLNVGYSDNADVLMFNLKISPSIVSEKPLLEKTPPKELLKVINTFLRENRNEAEKMLGDKK